VLLTIENCFHRLNYIGAVSLTIEGAITYKTKLIEENGYGGYALDKL
jgi:hypothetical protein